MAAKYVENIVRSFLLGVPAREDSLATTKGEIKAYPSFEEGMLIAREDGGRVMVEPPDKRFPRTVNKHLNAIPDVITAAGSGLVIVREPLGDLTKGVRMAEYFASCRK